ncbi:hypothetical protein V8C42DRAFT_140318 [Trichoderma barbatum]
MDPTAFQDDPDRPNWHTHCPKMDSHWQPYLEDVQGILGESYCYSTMAKLSGPFGAAMHIPWHYPTWTTIKTDIDFVHVLICMLNVCVAIHYSDISDTGNEQPKPSPTGQETETFKGYIHFRYDLVSQQAEESFVRNGFGTALAKTFPPQRRLQLQDDEGRSHRFSGREISAQGIQATVNH